MLAIFVLHSIFLFMLPEMGVETIEPVKPSGYPVIGASCWVEPGACLGSEDHCPYICRQRHRRVKATAVVVIIPKKAFGRHKELPTHVLCSDGIPRLSTTALVLGGRSDPVRLQVRTMRLVCTSYGSRNRKPASGAGGEFMSYVFEEKSPEFG
jgi:hypothetical protein